MLPLGSQNSGGRSSNLSPLAPPFTLDKPYHKQHNSNPPLIFIDQPYAPRFDRPRPPIEPVWKPPVNPTFGPNYPENSSNDASFAPLEVHGFPGSQPNNSSSSSTRLAPLNSAAGNGYDGFQYGQFSSSASTSLAEAKPYYPPYVVADDRESAARKEPSYDLLSNFGVNQLGGSGSSQVDETRTVPRVEYTPQWSGLWNGLNDVEQGSWLDLGGNYGSKDCKPSESSIGPKCVRKGSDAGGDRYNFHTGTLRPVGSLGSYAETSIKSTNCFDGFGGEKKFGSTSIEDRTSFKEPNPGPTVVSCIKMSSLGSTTAGNDSHHLHDPFRQDPLGNFGYYEGLVDSRDKHANYSDSYVCDSTSTVRSSPAHWPSFSQFPSTHYAAPSTTVNAVSNEAMDKTESTSDFRPYHPFGLNFQVSNFTGNTDSLFTGSSSTKLEDSVNKKQVNDDCFDQLLKTKSSSLIPHLSVAEFAKIKSDNAETFYSTEKFSDGPDIQNPAEDSPCWKGARFSPFEDSKMLTPDSMLEKTEPCFDPDIEEHKNPTGLDAVHISERSSNSNYASRERDGSCSMIQGSLKLCGTDGFQPTDEKRGLDREIESELSFFNYSDIASSSRNPLVLQLNSEGCVYMPEEKLEPSVAETVAEMNGKCVDANSSNNVFSCSPTNSGDHLVHSPSGNVSAPMTGQLSGKDSNSKVDISVLVTTLKNLSEVLVSHCSNSHDAPTELDGAALKHIISNLNSCLVKKADPSTETEKSQDPQQDKSYSDATLQVSKFTTAHTDPPHQHGLDTFSGCKGDILCNGNQDISDSSSLKDNSESIRDADTIEAIKKVLDMNFPSEEMQPESVLYKNLWLEAEAALCASTARARFNRIKIETGNRDSHRADDEENVPISNASDVNKAAEAPHEANDSLNSSKHSCQVDMESSVIARFRTLTSVVEDLKATKPVGGLDTTTIHVPAYACSSVSPQSQTRDIEASVMSRFKTLQSRADNSDLLSAAESGKSPSRANFRPPSPDHYSYFSSMANPTENPGAAVMSRFNILKARIEQPESLDMDTQQQLQGPSLTSLFSADNRFSVHPVGENIEDCTGTSMSLNPGKFPRRGVGLGDELLEGWYDCSEPGWEHVTKDGSPKQ